MRNRKSGFSLIELVIALAILAAATTIALRATSSLQDQARYQSTVSTLNNIQAAILGPVNQHNADGTALVTGFVADTGRLPIYNSGSDTGDPNGSVDPLNELVANPNSIAAYLPYADNIDSSVKVWVGWQGPYLHLGAGPTYIRDGWGDSLHAYDSSGNLISTAGTAIAQIASWGSDHLPDVNHEGSVSIQKNYADDVSIPNPTISSTTTGFAYTATVAGQVTMNTGTDTGGTSGPTPNPTSSGNAVSIWVDYIGPDLSQSPNPVGDAPMLVASYNSTTSLWTNYYYNLTSSSMTSSTSTTCSGQFVIPPTGAGTNVTIGPRVLKAYVLPSTVVNASGSDNTAFNYYVHHSTNPIYSQSTLNVTLTGGAQTINLVLPHYSP